MGMTWQGELLVCLPYARYLTFSIATLGCQRKTSADRIRSSRKQAIHNASRAARCSIPSARQP